MGEFAAALLRGAFGEPKAAMARVADAARPFGSDVQLVRAEAVASPRHVASAALHALRATSAGTNRAQSLGLEFLRYLSGERQIARAIAAAGLQPGAREAIGVALGGEPRRALEAAAAAVGAQLAWDVPSTAPEDAALERVALLDLEG